MLEPMYDSPENLSQGLAKALRSPEALLSAAMILSQNKGFTPGGAAMAVKALITSLLNESDIVLKEHAKKVTANKLP